LSFEKKKNVFFFNFQKNKIIYGFIYFLLIDKKNQNPQPITSYFRLPSLTAIEGHISQILFLQHLPYCYVLLLRALPLYRKFAWCLLKKELYSAKVFYGLGSEAKEALASHT